jgi:hypothetical protein
MFIAVQIILVAFGLIIMSRGRFRIGDREVSNPIASLVGIILAGQLPLALLIGIVLGFSDGANSTTVAIPTRAGQAQMSMTISTPRSTADYWWVDPLITCGAFLAATGLTAMALREANDTEYVIASLHPAESDAAR